MTAAGVVVLVSADPRHSGRAMEALRIAAGLAAGGTAVTVVLRGPAVQLLADDTDALVDGDDAAPLRESLRGLSVPCHVAPAPAEIAALVRASHRCLVF